MSTRTLPCRDAEVTVPSGASDSVSAPAVTLTVGSPKRAASAGVRMAKFGPFRSSMTDPSGFTVIFAGPDPFKVTVFPVSRFVNEPVSWPVTRKVVDPSEVWSIVTNSLSATAAAPTSNPQYVAGRVKGDAGKACQFGPRARAGDAVISPPAMPSSAQSTAITPSRLMAITSTSRPPQWPTAWLRVGAVTGQGTVVHRR